jgi:peptidoglycan/LPS O-acetylase OafA/YrhL
MWIIIFSFSIVVILLGVGAFCWRPSWGAAAVLLGGIAGAASAYTPSTGSPADGGDKAGMIIGVLVLIIGIVGMIADDNKKTSEQERAEADQRVYRRNIGGR